MIVGIDIGGTKTHVRVVDEAEETIIADFVVATLSWQYDHTLIHPLSAVALIALFESYLSDQSATSLVVGAHGCDSPQQISDFTDVLREVFSGSLAVYNDAELLGPAAGESQAIALIAGTGSIAIGRDEFGGVVSVGGHGWMLSDPGSAPALARESVVAILRRFDRGEKTDVLGELFQAQLGVTSIPALSYEFTRRATMQSWASLAPVVFEAADAGSHDAVDVIDRGAAELAAAVQTVLDRGAVATAVIAAGGVVTNQPMLEHSIRRHVQAVAPSLSVEVLRTAPVAGAITLGRLLHSQSFTR
ncbi:BadF/BadG/BcrA/BcrD ATPase family protein [Glaciibacter psychrotolerans]|uniref:N-acetylglucosamine kinase-like BadF-type ATPase n=1 Tax=Glaciibacter psychrotolerans TaxID=670054 RepID=A0A7Z0EEZ6_9MICO|nr:BadF/BadG/BcrA/BcrD ATPase family protein [Leifsonia psychrotolerans]NYJ20005.1 N-acetylglucosamine kinase-like BadF-type ATPase [Leifsonia psychrotolerans]